jgi:uncharacterized protein
MRTDGHGQRLRIYVGESDRWEGRPLYEALVRAAREQGLAGATVLRGVEGFGTNSRIHTVKVLNRSDDLPIVVELVDRADRIQQFLPTLDKMVSEGLVTIEKIEVLIYRQSQTADSTDTGELELETPEIASPQREQQADEFSGASEQVHQIIAKAKEEAAASHHVFVDSVHVLLAMIAEKNGVARKVFRQLGISTKAVAASLREEVTRESPSHEYLDAMDAKSQAEASWLGQNRTGPEHLLMALCEIRPSAATDILMRLGVQPRDVCRKVLELLGRENDWQGWIADHPDM